MHWLYRICLFFAILLLPQSGHAMDHRALSEHWAPHIYQQISSPATFKEDFITSFNYDLDWRSDNNWANLSYYPAGATVYYSVHETATHYFLGYYFYYPRTSAKANLMSGCMLAVVKEASPSGKLVAIATYNDSKWQWQTSRQIDGAQVSFNLSSGSGGSRKIELRDADPKGKGIQYYYGGKSEVPGRYSSISATSCSYQLLPIKILQLGLTQSSPNLAVPFTSRATEFHPPWLWGDTANDLWNSPAESLLRQKLIKANISLNYISHP